MSLPDDKTTLNFVLDKSIRYKLQILANADDMKLSPFVALKLQEVVEEFEKQILETFGENEFLQTYRMIFGHEYPPLIPYDPDEDFDEEMARRMLIKTLNGIPRSKGRTPGKQPPEFDVNLDDLLVEADKKKEPSDE